MNIFINDRSKLDDIVALVPTDAGPMERLTRLQDLERQFARFGDRAFPRKDVVLVNGRTKQFTVDVGPDGFVGDVWLLEILSPEQFAEVMAIADRMRANASEHEVCSLLINYR